MTAKLGIPSPAAIIMSKPKKDDAQDLPFETALKQLEELVERLEAGEVTLEESLEGFEAGVVLVRSLRGRLDRAQQRVDRIMEKEGGEIVAESVDLEGEEKSAADDDGDAPF